MYYIPHEWRWYPDGLLRPVVRQVIARPSLQVKKIARFQSPTPPNLTFNRMLSSKPSSWIIMQTDRVIAGEPHPNHAPITPISYGAYTYTQTLAHLLILSNDGLGKSLHLHPHNHLSFSGPSACSLLHSSRIVRVNFDSVLGKTIVKQTSNVAFVWQKTSARRDGRRSLVPRLATYRLGLCSTGIRPAGSNIIRISIYPLVRPDHI